MDSREAKRPRKQTHSVFYLLRFERKVDLLKNDQILGYLLYPPYPVFSTRDRIMYGAIREQIFPV